MKLIPFFLHSFSRLNKIWIAIPAITSMLLFLYLSHGRKKDVFLSAFKSAFMGDFIFILAATTLSRSPGMSHTVNLDIAQDWRMMFAGQTSVQIEVVANLLIFLPCGVFWDLINKRKEVNQQQSVNFCLCVTWGLFVSCLIEVTQYLFSMGSFELKDIICNTSGIAIGWVFGELLSLLYKIFLWNIMKMKWRKKKEKQ